MIKMSVCILIESKRNACTQQKMAPEPLRRDSLGKVGRSRRNSRGDDMPHQKPDSVRRTREHPPAGPPRSKAELRLEDNSGRRNSILSIEGPVASSAKSGRSTASNQLKMRGFAPRPEVATRAPHHKCISNMCARM